MQCNDNRCVAAEFFGIYCLRLDALKLVEVR